jgi:hypothetical protein
VSAKELSQTEKELTKAQDTLTSSTENLQYASENLEYAQENLDIQTESLRLKTQQQNDAQIMLAMTIATLGVSAVTALSSAWSAFGKMNVAGMIGKVTDAIKTHSSALGIGLTAIGAVTFAYMAFTAESPKARLAYSVLTAATLALTVAQIALAAAKAMNITLSTFGLGAIVVGAAIASFALVYGLASAFGGGGGLGEGITVPDVPEVNQGAVSGAPGGELLSYRTVNIENINIETNDPDAIGDALVTALNDRGLFT